MSESTTEAPYGTLQRLPVELIAKLLSTLSLRQMGYTRVLNKDFRKLCASAVARRVLDAHLANHSKVTPITVTSVMEYRSPYLHTTIIPWEAAFWCDGPLEASFKLPPFACTIRAASVMKLTWAHTLAQNMEYDGTRINGLAWCLLGRRGGPWKEEIADAPLSPDGTRRLCALIVGEPKDPAMIPLIRWGRHVHNLTIGSMACESLPARSTSLLQVCTCFLGSTLVVLTEHDEDPIEYCLDVIGVALMPDGRIVAFSTAAPPDAVEIACLPDFGRRRFVDPLKDANRFVVPASVAALTLRRWPYTHLPVTSITALDTRDCNDVFAATCELALAHMATLRLLRCEEKEADPTRFAALVRGIGEKARCLEVLSIAGGTSYVRGVTIAEPIGTGQGYATVRWLELTHTTLHHELVVSIVRSAAPSLEALVLIGNASIAADHLDNMLRAPSLTLRLLAVELREGGQLTDVLKGCAQGALASLKALVVTRELSTWCSRARYEKSPCCSTPVPTKISLMKHHVAQRLFYAVLHNQTASLQLLIDRRCNLTVRDNNGDSASDLARKLGHTACIALLDAHTVPERETARCGCLVA